MSRARCCGRFAYWRRPLGPWTCARCYRSVATGPVPANAERALAEHAQARAASLGPWTEIERELVRACFGPLATFWPEIAR